MKIITSKDNPLFKTLSKIESSSRERKASGKTLLDGIHLVSACLESGLKPELIVLKESLKNNHEFIELNEYNGTVLMSDSLFDRISTVRCPTGILALIPVPAERPDASPDCCIFLDEIQDPGNMGAILRAAAASGASDAFLSKGCADPWSPKVLRAGMGAHFGIRIHMDSDIGKIITHFEGNTVAMTLEAEQSIFELDLRGKVGFLIGNEGSGISDKLLSFAGTRAKIPMPGKIESLNAAQAAAICLFERVRQST